MQRGRDGERAKRARGQPSEGEESVRAKRAREREGAEGERAKRAALGGRPSEEGERARGREGRPRRAEVIKEREMPAQSVGHRLTLNEYL